MTHSMHFSVRSRSWTLHVLTGWLWQTLANVLLNSLDQKELAERREAEQRQDDERGAFSPRSAPWCAGRCCPHHMPVFCFKPG